MAFQRESGWVDNGQCLIDTLSGCATRSTRRLLQPICQIGQIAHFDRLRSASIVAYRLEQQTINSQTITWPSLRSSSDRWLLVFFQAPFEFTWISRNPQEGVRKRVRKGVRKSISNFQQRVTSKGLLSHIDCSPKGFIFWFIIKPVLIGNN